MQTSKLQRFTVNKTVEKLLNTTVMVCRNGPSHITLERVQIGITYLAASIRM